MIKGFKKEWARLKPVISPLLHNDYKPIPLIIIFMIVLTLFELSTPIIIKNIVDYGISAGSEANLIKWVMILVAVEVLFVLSYYTHLVIEKSFLKRYRSRASIRLYEHVMSMPESFHKKYNSGDLINRFMNDLQGLLFFSPTSILMNMKQILFVITISVILLFLNPILTGLISICIPLMYWVFKKNAKKLYLKSDIIKRQLSVLVQRLEDHFKSSTGLNASPELPFRSTQIHSQVNNVEDLRLELELYRVKVSFVNNAVNIISMVLLWGVGGFFVLRGEITFGLIIAFAHYLKIIEVPLRNIMSLPIQYSGAKASLDRYAEIFDYPVVENFGTNEVPCEIKSFDISKGMFGYIQEECLFDNLAFKLKSGECLVLHGKSGGGKSTLLKILSNSLSLGKGTLCINNTPIQQYSKESIKKNIHLVSESPFIFNASILDNIILGSTFEEKAVLKAIETVELSDVLELFPLGLQGMLDEGGENISKGQRQRIGLARAILQRPSILLLDESTSGLDSELEVRVLNRIISMHKNNIVIFSTHNKSLGSFATQIIDLDKYRGVVSE